MCGGKQRRRRQLDEQKAIPIWPKAFRVDDRRGHLELVDKDFQRQAGRLSASLVVHVPSSRSENRSRGLWADLHEDGLIAQSDAITFLAHFVCLHPSSSSYAHIQLVFRSAAYPSRFL